MDNIQSCLNYTGGKFKLLNQIIPLFPNDIDVFVDLFCGGANVGINAKANKIECYDNVKEVIDLFNFIKDIEGNDMIISLEKIIEEYGLSSTFNNGYKYYNCDTATGLSQYNRESYIRLRNDYNARRYRSQEEKNLWFYILIIYGFNNQIRFNRKGEFNIPIGKRDFNKNLRNKFIKFSNRIREIDITFKYSDFRNLKIENLKRNDFIYVDPPYLITLASYNEQGGWTERDERDLLTLLDDINDRGIKFALSNVIECKGKENTILRNWSNKYNVHFLDYNYNFSNYQIKDRKSKTLEVLICNY